MCHFLFTVLLKKFTVLLILGIKRCHFSLKSKAFTHIMAVQMWAFCTQTQAFGLHIPHKMWAITRSFGHKVGHFRSNPFCFWLNLAHMSSYFEYKSGGIGEKKREIGLHTRIHTQIARAAAILLIGAQELYFKLFNLVIIIYFL